MPPSIVTAVKTPVKYFARVEYQQKWREGYERQGKKNSDDKWKVLLT